MLPPSFFLNSQNESFGKGIRMSYNDLSECTLDPAERVAEAGRIIEMLAGHEYALSTKELTFINGLQSSVSVKQLFWLRDIKDRVL